MANVLGFVYYASYNVFTSKYFPWMPHAGVCSGGDVAAVTGILILSSYLLLFMYFYYATYVRTKRNVRHQTVRWARRDDIHKAVSDQVSVANLANGYNSTRCVATNRRVGRFSKRKHTI